MGRKYLADFVYSSKEQHKENKYIIVAACVHSMENIKMYSRRLHEDYDVRLLLNATLKAYGNEIFKFFTLKYLLRGSLLVTPNCEQITILSIQIITIIQIP